jgi:glycosyltransferase involved in cell wall biosynthesis
VVAVCRSLEETARGHAPHQLVARLEDTTLLGDGEEGEEDLREALSLSGPVIMYVGNLETYQGMDLLLAAHSMVLREIQDAELVIIGGIEEDIRKYRDLARELGTEGRTHFIGPRPTSQLGHYLRQADVLCSPRIAGDNTPMKIYSYLDSGRPVVATRLETHVQVLDDDVAQLVEPDPLAMASGLACLLRNPARRELLAERARILMKRQYSRAAFQRKLTDFYARLATRLREGKMRGSAMVEKAPREDGD